MYAYESKIMLRDYSRLSGGSLPGQVCRGVLAGSNVQNWQAYSASQPTRRSRFSQNRGRNLVTASSLFARTAQWHEIEACGLEVAHTAIVALLQRFHPCQEGGPLVSGDATPAGARASWSPRPR